MLASVMKAFPMPIMIGLCLPKVCTVENMNEYKVVIVTTFNKAIYTVFKDIKGFDRNTVLDANDMEFNLSAKENEIATEADIITVLFFIIVIIFLVLAIVGTIARCYK
jgi:hypothetical protein